MFAQQIQANKEKMNIIFKLTLVVCLLDLTVAVRLRENLNVLVPNNDVNFNEKIKTLLSSGDEIDNDDFSDNEIENLREIENSKVDKLRKQNQQISNRVYDDKNRNIEENQIERESLIDMEANFTTPFTPSLPNNETTFTTSLPINETISFPPSPPINGTTPTYLNYTTLPESSEPSFNLTAPVNATTPTFNTTESLSNETYHPSTIPVTSNYSATTLTESTQPSNITSWTTDPYNSTINETTEFNSTEINTTEIPMTVPTSPTSTTEEPIFDDLQSDECLLGKAERHMKWVGIDGRLAFDVIETSKGLDLSNFFEGYQDYMNFEGNNLTNTTSRSDFTVR